MKDKRNIIIAILILIIALGAGYIWGSSKNNTNKKEIVTTSESSKQQISKTTETSEESTSESSASSSTVQSTTDTEPKVSELSQAQQAMSPLVGEWGVPNSGVFLTIHSAGYWSTDPVGPGDVIKFDVVLHSFDETTNTVFLDRDGEPAELTIISNDKFTLNIANQDVNTFERLNR
ncbi:MAG: hypothetical protein RR470_11485 [Vagococcus sp.]|uniref:hypothetical protein n=1 Tax=Vagococcus sp. TaxID=1933889 RepID=UPI002FC91583